MASRRKRGSVTFFCYYNLTYSIGNVVRLHYADDIRLRRILCKLVTLVEAAFLIDQPATHLGGRYSTRSNTNTNPLDTSPDSSFTIQLSPSTAARTPPGVVPFLVPFSSIS